MEPYPQITMTREEGIYNCHLSRAMRVVENAFGIVAHRLWCIHTPCHRLWTEWSPFVMACCVLHNRLRNLYPHKINQPLEQEDPYNGMTQGSWRTDEDLVSLYHLRLSMATMLQKWPKPRENIQGAVTHLQQAVCPGRI